MKYEKPKQVTAPPVITPGSLERDPSHVGPHLVYSFNMEPDPKIPGRSRLSITGMNASATPYGFKKIAVQLLAITSSNLKPIFKETNPAKWIDKDAKPTPTKPTKPTGKPEEKPAEKPAGKTEEKPKGKSEEEPEDKSGGKLEDKREGEVEEQPKDKSEDKPGDKPEDGPEDKPEEKPEEKPEDKPEEKPEEKDKDKPAGKPNKKPDPAKPTTTWRTEALNLDQGLKAQVQDFAGAIIFNIVPFDKGTKKLLKKFAMERGSAARLELEGAINPMGKYLIKMTEIWTDPDMDDEVGDVDLDGYVDYYAVVTVQYDGRGEGLFVTAHELKDMGLV